jgi:hypothetical protein
MLHSCIGPVFRPDLWFRYEKYGKKGQGSGCSYIVGGRVIQYVTDALLCPMHTIQSISQLADVIKSTVRCAENGQV